MTEALRLADLWLDEATDLPSGVTTIEAWSQVDWVEKTLGTWSALCDPVRRRVVAAMSSAMPPEVAEQAGPMAPMMSQFGGMMFGAQLGQGIAALAGEVVSQHRHRPAARPDRDGGAGARQPRRFAEGLERPADEVRLYPGAARGRPPAPVRPRPVAAPAADRGRRRLRTRHRASTRRPSRRR